MKVVKNGTMAELMRYLEAHDPSQRNRPSDDTIVSLVHIFFGPWDRVKIAWRIIKTIW